MIQIREYKESDEFAVKKIFSQGQHSFFRTCVKKHLFW